jgi:Protein of unknown function (DUF2845)
VTDAPLNPDRAWRRAGATLLVISMAVAFAPSSHAETLRCSGGSAAEGDSRNSVLYKCGQPALKDNFCAPLYYGPNLQLVPEPWAGTVLPCQTIEEWLYERGPGNMVATLRFRSGVLQSIRYGRSPR